MQSHLKGQKGFTLVEVLVVIAVIGILAALLLPATNIAKAKAKRTTCLNNLRQINMGLRMYSDDSSDYSPKTPHTHNFPTMRNIVDYTGFKELMKHNVGLNGPASAQERIFACPNDFFYHDLSPAGQGYVSQGFHEQSFTDYSSYGFNAGQPDPIAGQTPGLAGMKISSVKVPAKTVLVTELPALFPYSWHEPRGPVPRFNDAKNILTFVDGHASLIKIYWNSQRVIHGGVSYVTDAMDYDPPAGYEYQWSGN